MKAKIQQNDKGGWSIHIGGRVTGNFPFRIDAIRACLRNHIKWEVLSED